MALSGIYPVTIADARFEETYTSIAGTNLDFKGWKLGDVCIDNLGGQWMFVKANEALTVYSLCVITNASLQDGTYLAEMAEITDINTGPKFLGINQVAIASGSYGWLWRGPGGRYGSGIKVRSANMTAGALSFPLAGSPGVIDDANVDEGVIAGLTTLATTTTEAGVECVATMPLTCNIGETD